MAERLIHLSARKNVVKAALARFKGHRGSHPRARRRGWRAVLRQRFTTMPATAVPDPVSLAIFAIDRVGPAAVRACASGVEVLVAAPDEATAQVVRAALAETAQRRTTDQLIRIVVS